MTNPIRVGISSCLLGQQVRFDAGHKRDRYVTDVLAKYFEWVPVCPELEVGMGVPREPVRLVGSAERPSMVGVKSGEDWTSRMEQYSRKRSARLAGDDLSGFILKSDSPSCGLLRVKLYGKEGGMATRQGTGLFAASLSASMPLLPIEEEGRLNDDRLRENFVERVFAFRRLQDFFASRTSVGALVEFHSKEKYLLLSHSPKHYTLLGRLVASAAKRPPAEVKESYGALFMQALAVQATVKKHTNVLHHVFGFVSDGMDDDDRKELLGLIEEYRKETLPLVVPLTMLSHVVRKQKVEYIIRQSYLNPHPKELMLRNHV